ILRPLTPPAALMASTAKATPRLKPSVGAELGPVIAARQPILIGSESANAGVGNENDAAPNAPALPNKTSRREMAIKILPFRFLVRRPSRGSRASVCWLLPADEPDLQRRDLSRTQPDCPEPSAGAAPATSHAFVLGIAGWAKRASCADPPSC